MKSEEGLGSVKRFGARYGRKTKLKFSKVETEQRKLHKCPYCNKVAVKRLAAGIWNCRKCGAKFAGKAYSVSRVIILKEPEQVDEAPQEVAQEPESTEINEAEEEA